MLERVVAALYKAPGISIRTNVQYPTTDGERSREIDIVLTANIEGLSVEYVFQCKNEAGPLGVNKIGEFHGAMKDIGVPTKYGIFVGVNGFTKDAIAYARKYGIQTLVLKGLSKDRLRAELGEAIQHNIFLLPRFEKFTVQNNASREEFDGQFSLFLDENSKPAGTFADLIFNKWRNGEIPEQLGTYDLELELPEGWFQFYRGEKLIPQRMTARVSVLAVVITIDGKAENFTLFDAGTRKAEKFKAEVKFRKFKKGEVVPLHVISSEEELTKLSEGSSRFRMSVKTKLPRMVLNGSYYPLSRHVADIFFGQMQKYGMDLEKVPQERIQEEIWKASENDIFRVGEISFAGKEMPIICTDSDGEILDVTLLYEKKEYDKIISLTDKYRKNPFDTFRDLIAWSHVEKGRLLLDSASNGTNENQKQRIRNESRAQAEAALKLIPNFVPAVDLLSCIAFAEKRYEEALKAIEYILQREPENVALWQDRTLAFMKLRNWTAALESIDKAAQIESNESTRTLNYIRILLRRSFILHKLENFESAWSDMFLAWRQDPLTVVERLAFNSTIDTVVDRFPTIDGLLLLIEVRYCRFVEFLKRRDQSTAESVADEAFALLGRLKKREQLDSDPLIEGPLDGEILEGMLTRTLERFRGFRSNEIVDKQITSISSWFSDTFEEIPDFLENA